MDTTMTRRAALTGAASASIIIAAGGAAAMIPTTRDEVERHWQDRCAAYRELEADERFLDNDAVQEPYWRRIDAAEIAILASTFRTRRTAELQLWIGWSHYEPSSSTVEKLVTQGDYAALARMRAALDWNEKMLFAAITTLRGEA
ncbi:hypothetical protein GCM10022268_24080 [Sphingomonas cynarae]|uniref:Uncharacterized protein n=1 Tax=Sphingomonas cynarae TaxID=930197 RepID=A0ABP7E5F9_9SPHN